MYAVVSYGTVSRLICILCCDERLIGGVMESLSVPYENHCGRHTGNDSIEVSGFSRTGSQIISCASGNVNEPMANERAPVNLKA